MPVWGWNVDELVDHLVLYVQHHLGHVGGGQVGQGDMGRLPTTWALKGGGEACLEYILICKSHK
jgi:hypothetical protein